MGSFIIHADNGDGHKLEGTNCKCNPQMFEYSDLPEDKEVHIKILKTLRVITGEEHMEWILIGGALLLIAGLAVLIVIKNKKKDEPVIVPPEEPPVTPGTYVPPQYWEDEAYLFLYPDVSASSVYGTNPLAHYMEYGKAEGRIYMPEGWNPVQYLKNNQDVAAVGAKPLLHYWQYGKAEGRTYTQEITNFLNLPECNNPKSIYFGIGKVNDMLHFGEYGYQNGDNSSIIYSYPHNLIQEFDCESVFCIKEFNGKYFLSCEHGKYKSGVNKAMIYRLDGNNWVEAYRHPRWDLMFNMHVHNGYLYAVGCKLSDRSDPAGAVRTKDGYNWEVYFENPYEYRFWDMTTLGNDIWFSSTSSGVDYGGNDCNPAVFKNTNLVWRDSTRTNDGHLGIASFKGDIYLGTAGSGARVVRFSDKKVVLNRSNQCKINKLLVDESANTLFAFTCGFDGSNSGAEIWATKDGSNWYNVGGPLGVPHLFFAYYDPSTTDIYVTGGKWSQGNDGYGKIYKSIR